MSAIISEILGRIWEEIKERIIPKDIEDFNKKSRDLMALILLLYGIAPAPAPIPTPPPTPPPEGYGESVYDINIEGEVVASGSFGFVRRDIEWDMGETDISSPYDFIRRDIEWEIKEA